ncbi:MAG: VWA domain-containing protein [Planctomycetes bacterium]|nr:VWA domain-containing protein [Planctomycetota bacterium]
MSGLSFEFAELGWVHLLWGILLIVLVLVAVEFRRRSVLERLVSRMMQARLAHRTSSVRRLIALLLTVTAMVLLVGALMRPRWGYSVQATVRIQSQIMVCLDVSKSMLAEDVAPNRLERAKVELDSLLGLMGSGEQVGLTAFSGKAAVLCPMTTDFGFLRLILIEAGPDSVGLGGTKIGEAIGKAVDGFRDSGDINRLIILITDGEDHDSYPLDAAKRAKEKGVKIVCIGFGDEAGSKIELTDPNTGVRSFLRDQNGNDVVTRLDGETLRDIALATEGAYVPAGTGALDLEAIYRSHIASLLRGSLEQEQRHIPNDIYRWFVGAAILFLIAGLITASPLTLRARAFAVSSQIAVDSAAIKAVAVFVLLFLPVPYSRAAQPASKQPAGTSAKPSPAETNDGTAPKEPSEKNAAKAPAAKAPAAKAPAATEPAAGSAQPTEQANEGSETPLPPREAYNLALDHLDSDPDRAEQLLNQARRDAGVDGEVRFRALYNLGWVEVSRADTLLAEDPKRALQHLHQAGNRFREAVRVRADSVAARHNLEIVSRRILELTDSLNKKDPGDLAQRLDALIDRQRQCQGELRAVVEQSGASVEKTHGEKFRQDFRNLGVGQREVISEFQQFAEDARKEQDALKQKSDQDITPKEKLLAIQLENMLTFVDSSLQRMNMARGLTRRMQGGRAFQRWSVALSDAKRARDQLRNPVEILGQILADSVELAGHTRGLAAAKSLVPQDQKGLQLPAWLTVEFVRDLQSAINERTAELHDVLAQSLAAQPKPEPQPAGPTLNNAPQNQAPPPADASTERLFANIRDALPLLDTAKASFGEAAKDLDANSCESALQHQGEAIEALSSAWELFFDIRRLIEAIYRDEQIIQAALAGLKDRPQLVQPVADAMAEAQRKHLARCQRLDDMLQFEKEQLNVAAAEQAAKTPAGQPAPSPPADAERVKAETERFERACQILAQTVHHLEASANALQEVAATPAPVPPEPPAQGNADVPNAPQQPTPGEPPRVEGPPEDDPAPPGTESSANGPHPKTPKPAGNEQPPAADVAAKDAPENAVEPDDSTPQTGAGQQQSESGAPAKAEGAIPPVNNVPPVDSRLVAAEQSVELAIEQLEELRRLFFSLVEHLRDTAQRQADLNDDTTEVSGRPEEERTPDKTGPLAGRQTQLQSIAAQIAEALKAQGDEAAAAADQQAKPPAGQGQSDPQDAARAAEALARAAGLVRDAESAMETAAEKLSAVPAADDDAQRKFEPILEKQQEALAKLIEALALIDQQNQQDQDQQDQQQQDQNQQDQQQDQGGDEQQRQNQQMDARQLLQLIRDREAERRNDKRQRNAASSSAAEKDW